MIGRRLATVGEIERPGDYCGPTLVEGYEGEQMFFRAANVAEERGSLCRVQFPPHTYRECADGSLEVRASILVYDAGPGAPQWHGYLDCGHVWRSV